VARAIGDYLVFGSREAPIADLYTDRQAVGRAFAAEFLAPARGVIHMIEDEQQPMVTVADHYGVDLEVVSRQYRNNPALHAQA
jgi:Zn-dependent peptidase ImmA (M78 family)